MMSYQVNCLHFEDEPSQQQQIATLLRIAWTLVKDGKCTLVPKQKVSDLHIEAADKWEEAIATLTNRGAEFQLLVVDLLCNTPGSDELSPHGLNIVEVARAYNPNIGILCISKAEQEPKHASIRNAFHKKAALPAPGKYGTHGADFIPKAWILNGQDPIEMSKVADTLVKIMVDAGSFEAQEMIDSDQANTSINSRTLKILYDVNALSFFQLRLAVETIGEDVMSTLISPFLPEGIAECKLHLVSPGMSGASVFRVTCPTIKEDDINLLLKVSRDKPALEQEVQRYPNLGGALSRIFARFERTVQSHDSGWHALCADFQVDSITFTEWLARTNTRYEPSMVLNEVFTTGLRPVYKNLTPHPNGFNTFAELRMSRHATLKVLAATESLSPLAVKYSSATTWPYDASYITAFLEDRDDHYSDLRKIRRPAMRCRNHGDLHGRNILVPTMGLSIRLIDPALSEQMLWCRDLARFSVDLFLSSLDSGIESHEWLQFEGWLNTVSDFLDRKQLEESGTEKNIRVLQALNWVQDNLHSLFPECIQHGAHNWEWLLALAVEFMRFSAHLNVPFPKRALSITCASEALKRAELLSTTSP